MARSVRRSPRQRLEDMRNAISRAQRYVAGVSLDDYRYDDLRRDAVERCIEIISGASRHLTPGLLEVAPEMPWRAIRDIGNVLRHAYDGVDDEAIWRTATRDLIELERAVIAMIRLMERGDADP